MTSLEEVLEGTTITQFTGAYGTPVTNGTSVSNTSFWEQSNPTEMSFIIDGEYVKFEGKEIVYLKEMLTDWVKINRPESLL